MKKKEMERLLKQAVMACDEIEAIANTVQSMLDAKDKLIADLSARVAAQAEILARMAEAGS